HAKNAERSERVDPLAQFRLLDRFGNGNHRRKMIDNIRAFDGGGEQVALLDAAANKAHIDAREVGFVPRAQVVQHGDPRTATAPVARKMASNEAGASRDGDVHRSSLLPVRPLWISGRSC